MTNGNEDLPGDKKLELRDTSIKNVLRQRRRFLLGHLQWPRLPLSILLIILISIALWPVGIIHFFKRKINKNPLLGTLLLFILAPIIALSINAFLYQTYQVDGISMEPTLQNNDRLLIDKTSRTWSRITGHPYTPHRSDIIIFNQDGLFDVAGNQEKQIIKRVIGLPGERVLVNAGKITIFNSAYPSGFDPDANGKYNLSTNQTTHDTDVVLSPSQIFVCGDNRSNSTDSRIFGPIELSKVIGKLDARILPIDKVKSF